MLVPKITQHMAGQTTEIFIIGKYFQNFSAMLDSSWHIKHMNLNIGIVETYN